MKAFFFIATLLLIFRGNASGQVLRGRVLDSTDQPIPFATLLVEGTSRGTAAGEEGQFELSVPTGAFVVRVSAVGFVTYREPLRIGAGDTLDTAFHLQEQVLSSDEVVVTASRREQAAMTVPVSVAILGARDLEARNALALDDVLETVPGVQILDNQVNIRGSGGFAYNTGSRVLMMVDGMPLMTPDQDGIPLEALPTTEIERIEVLKGPGSALYGSGAIGGVINVITKDMPESPVTTVRLFSGAYQPFRYRVWRESWSHGNEPRPFVGGSVSHARKTSPEFGWWASASWRTDSGYRAFSKKTTFHGFAKLDYRPDPANRMELLLGTLIRQRDLFLFWQSGRAALQPGLITIGSDATGDPSDPTGATDDLVNQISILPSFTHIVGPRLYYTVRSRVFGTYVRPIANDTGKPRALSEGSVGFRYGAELQLNWIPRETSRLTIGTSWDALTTRNSFFVTTDGDELGGQPEGAVFLHAEQTFLERFDVVAGARYDTYRIDRSATERRLSPKFSVAWRTSPVFTIRAAFGDGFRVPSFAERFTDNSDFFPIVRNLDLRPERSRSFEVGIRTRLELGGIGTWHADVVAFHSTYHGFIEPRLSTELQAFQFQNLPETGIQGVETSLEWSAPSERTSGRAGYTLLSTEERATGLALPFRPRHQITLSLDSHIVGRFSAGFDYRFVSRPDRIETDFARFVRDAEVLVATRLLDARMAYERGPWRAALILDNALHYQYLERPALLGAPRNLTLQLTWQNRAR